MVPVICQAQADKDKLQEKIYIGMLDHKHAFDTVDVRLLGRAMMEEISLLYRENVAAKCKRYLLRPYSTCTASTLQEMRPA